LARFFALLLLSGLAMAQHAVTLARLEADPAAFAGREVVLVGYAWSWLGNDKPPACRGVPAARGNVMRTRSDGYFCDGTRVVFLPPYSGAWSRGPKRAVQLLARLQQGPEGWWLEPLKLR